jgi:hypothetical protein
VKNSSTHLIDQTMLVTNSPLAATRPAWYIWPGQCGIDRLNTEPHQRACGCPRRMAGATNHKTQGILFTCSSETPKP